MGLGLFLLALFHCGASFAKDRADSYPPEWTSGKTYCPDGKTEAKGNGFFGTTRNSGALRLWEEFNWVDQSLQSLRENTCYPAGVALADKLKPLLDALRDNLREGVQASACELSGTTAESRGKLARDVPARIQAAEKWIEGALDDRIVGGALDPAINDQCLKAVGSALDVLPMALGELSCELLITRNRLAYLNEKYDQGDSATYICADDAVPARLDPSVDDRGIPRSDITGLGTH